MISNLGDHSTELDLLAAEGVPGSMYIAGTDTVSKVPPNKVYVIFFQISNLTPLTSRLLSLMSLPVGNGVMTITIKH